MNTLFNIVFVSQIVSALVIIGLVLLQHGKGADMGAAFGSGTSGSLFGATGSSNFLSKSTSFATAAFFIATLMLAHLGKHHSIILQRTVKNKIAITTLHKKDISATQKIPD
jgi:preprotein translocase subunit SecG